jgi:carbon-monoxide dehydrogenase small subunit
MDVTVEVNGRLVTIAVPDDQFLCDLLRDDLGLTGTKVGCREGVCGSCTVLLDDRPVRSCLVLAAQADGGHVLTIEGLAVDGRLHPVQQAIVEQGALQCGFCTSGMVISAVAFLDRAPRPDREGIAAALAGNLCRCTGYVKVIEAVASAAEAGFAGAPGAAATTGGPER